MRRGLHPIALEKSRRLIGRCRYYAPSWLSKAMEHTRVIFGSVEARSCARTDFVGPMPEAPGYVEFFCRPFSTTLFVHCGKALFGKARAFWSTAIPKCSVLNNATLSDMAIVFASRLANLLRAAALNGWQAETRVLRPKCELGDVKCQMSLSCIVASVRIEPPCRRWKLASTDFSLYSRAGAR